jgi:serine/threonine protein kinase
MDIKPANILVTSTMECGTEVFRYVIGDFGSALTK